MNNDHNRIVSHHSHTPAPPPQKQQALPRLANLRFEFYNGTSTNTGRCVIDVPGTNTTPLSTQLAQLVTQHSVPQPMRFSLLHRLQLARSFPTLQGRRQAIRVRLLAFYVLFQSNPGHEELARLFSTEPEFVSELVGVLRAEQHIPEDIRTLAVRALAVQLLDRTRHTGVIAAISGPGQGSVLSTLMHTAIASITATPQPRCSVTYVEAVLSLVGALVASTSGCTALSDAGVIPALLPLFRDPNAQHVGLVSSAVRILESFMDVNPSAGVLLRELGGLTDMLQRLEMEVGLRPGGDADGSPVPYTRRVLIKGLLRAVAMVSYTPAPGGGRTQVCGWVDDKRCWLFFESFC